MKLYLQRQLITMSSVEFPEIEFTDNDYNFDHSKCIKSLELPPIEHTSNNENILFEFVKLIEITPLPKIFQISKLIFDALL